MSNLTNVGSFDRLVRFIIGGVLIAAPYFYVSEIWEDPLYRWGLPFIGLVLVVTALLRFCPLYRIIGLRTCSR